MVGRRSKGRAQTGTERLTAADLLRAVPHVNAAAQTTPTVEGGAVVQVPMRRPAFLVPPLSWILPYSEQRRVELDATGLAVLNLCDGRRTVEEVVECFAGQNHLSFREGQIAVTEFLRQLTQRGIVALVGRK